jgi:flagellar biosynthetic protein FliR
VSDAAVMEAQALSFLATLFLVFCRVGAFALASPPFSQPGVPVRVRLALGIGISLLLAGGARSSPAVIEGALSDAGLLALAVLREAALGLALGLAVTAIFSAIRMAGEIVGIEMGFHMAAAIDPQTGQSVPTLAQLYEITGWLLFLAIDGHHFLIGALGSSFLSIPVGSFTLRPALAASFVQLVGVAMQSAILIACPLLALLFATSVTIALLARAVPNLHLLDFGYPVRTAVAIGAVAVVLPRSRPAFEALFRVAESWLAGALRPG